MAKRSKSGLKRKRQTVRRTARNQAVRSMLKTLVKNARQAAAPGAPEILAAIKQLDSAARKGIIHRNAAARSKSRLLRRAAQPAQGGAQPGSPRVSVTPDPVSR